MLICYGCAYVSLSLVSYYLSSGRLVGWRVEGFEHLRGRSVAMLPQKKEDNLVQELLESLFEVLSPFCRPQLVNGKTKNG